MKLEAALTLSWIGAGSVTPAMEDLVLLSFDELAPREHLTVLFDVPPVSLLRRLQSERPRRFEWTPLPAGPAASGVQIFRRAATDGVAREVNEALSWDHDRLDALESAAFLARAEGRFGDAAALFPVFSFGLRRHIRFEEEILFPEFDARSGFPAEMGPTSVMRMEHQEILRTLSAIEAAIGRPDGEAEALRRELHGILGPHNAKEEAVVYPGTDRALGPDERDALIARIHAAA